MKLLKKTIGWILYGIIMVPVFAIGAFVILYMMVGSLVDYLLWDEAAEERFMDAVYHINQ